MTDLELVKVLQQVADGEITPLEAARSVSTSSGCQY